MNCHKLFFSKVVGLNAPRSVGKAGNKGFTLIEIIVVMAVLGILALMSIPMYNNYINKAKNARAIADVRTISNEISAYTSDNGGTNPDDLGKINRANLLDPWGRKFEYNNFFDTGANPPLESPMFAPLNTDFDIYSKGEDGDSKPEGDYLPFNKDDIVRTREGAFVGRRHPEP